MILLLCMLGAVLLAAGTAWGLYLIKRDGDPKP